MEGSIILFGMEFIAGDFMDIILSLLSFSHVTIVHTE